jgi:hypothetical protein
MIGDGPAANAAGDFDLFFVVAAGGIVLKPVPRKSRRSETLLTKPIEFGKLHSENRRLVERSSSWPLWGHSRKPSEARQLSTFPSRTDIDVWQAPLAQPRCTHFELTSDKSLYRK